MNKQTITGDFMIFKGEYGYSTAISKKNEDGTYDKMYLSIQLPKGTELENKTRINVAKGFISFYKTKNGLAVPKFVIQEFETEQESEDYEENFGNDLPF
jgi:hypothetical protein